MGTTVAVGVYGGVTAGVTAVAKGTACGDFQPANCLIWGLLRSLSLNRTASMLSGVFEKLANPLTGCRNIGCLLVARNSSYYSTNIVDRPRSFRTEWRRTYPDGSCSFDRGGRQTVRHSKRRLAVGRRSADIA